MKESRVEIRTATVLVLAVVAITVGVRRLDAGEVGDAAEGYRLLTEKSYLPADFDQETFDQIWRVWPEPERSQAAASTLAERRRMAMRRYGLTPRPNDPLGRPLQYVVSEAGEWSMNCFACHGGQVEGKPFPGSPNIDYALEQLTADVRSTKLRLSKPLTHMDLGSLVMPLGTTRGTTNAVMFGVALLAYRHDDLTLRRVLIPPPMVHHDMDAPPWWHFQHKDYLYADGFAPRGHRALMQFMLVEQNGPEEFQEWEADFRHVFAYLTSLSPPPYSGRVDRQLAAAGQQVFADHCASCHGHYEGGLDYPERTIAWEKIGTDPVRLRALTAKHRTRYATSWFHQSAPSDVILEPGGYVAPPLTGIWASAPYLHNGSVPTLWHLLRPDNRPVVWTRRSHRYDHRRLGLDVEELAEPANDAGGKDRHEYFDSRRHGKQATGHEFPAELSESEKTAVLEYLKTL